MREKDLKRDDENNVYVHVLEVSEVRSKVVQDTSTHELNDAVEFYELEGCE